MAVKNILVPAGTITQNSVVVTWETDAGEENTLDGVRYGLTNFDRNTGEIENTNMTTFHSITVEGLDPNTTYRFQPHSRLPADRDDLPYASGDGTGTFMTKAPGQVTSMTVQSDKTEIAVGEVAVLTVTAQGSGGSVAGKPIVCSITNGEPGQDPRGEFAPVSPVVGGDPGNSTEIRFTGKHKGKAKIQIQSGTAGDNVEIIVKL